jgi:hypothetical protein
MTKHTTLDRVLGMTRFTITEGQRVLGLRRGRFEAILGPGEHRMKARGSEGDDIRSLVPPVRAALQAGADRRTA